PEKPSTSGTSSEQADAKSSPPPKSIKKETSKVIPAPSDSASNAPTMSKFALTWTFDPSKAVKTPDGAILLPVPSNKPYQEGVYEITGVRSQRVVQKGDCWIVAVLPGKQPFQLRVTVTGKTHKYALPESGKPDAPIPESIKPYLAEDQATNSRS